MALRERQCRARLAAHAIAAITTSTIAQRSSIAPPAAFFGVHSIAIDSKGNLCTTETYEGKRVQKFVYKGMGEVKAEQGVPWPRRAPGKL